MVGAHAACEIETGSRRANREDGGRATETGQRNGAQPDGAHALHQHRVARPQRRALEDVHRGQEAAARADVVVEGHGVGQPRDADARLEIDGLRPSAEQPLGGRIGDPVDAPRAAARRRSMDRARPASPAGAMHVEEHGAVPFAKRRAVQALQRPADGREHACRDVARE